MPISRVLLCVLVAGALLLLWLAFAPDAPADPARALAQPVGAAAAPLSASIAASAGDADAAPAERIPAAGSAITVHGRIVGATDPGCVWLGERRELGFARFDAETGFSFRCAGPLTSARLRAVDATGAGRTFDFTRPEGEAMSAWDLGDVRFGGADVTVDLTIEYDPPVVRRMLGTGQQRIVVELHEERANGPLVASSEFDLAAFTAATRTSFLRTVVATLSSADADVVVTWRCVVDPRRSGALTLKQEERLGGELGLRRSSRLELVPEQEVRGTVTLKNGEVCSAIEVMLMNAAMAGLYSTSIRSGKDGVYSFHVGTTFRGTVGLCGVIQILTGQRQQVPVSSGTVADLCHAVDKVFFRLVDAQGSAITGYRAGSRNALTLTPAQLEQDTHPDGVAWTAGCDLREFPWLMFHLPEQQEHVALVPAEWLRPGARAIHDVSVASFLPAGSVQVTDDGTVPASWGKTMLRLCGKAELRGLQLDKWAPGAGPWRIDGVPVGSYDYEATCWGGRLQGSGEVVVTAERTARVRLTHR